MDSKHSDTRWATENDRWCNGGKRGEVYSKEKSDYEGAAWVSKYVCWLEGTIKKFENIVTLIGQKGRFHQLVRNTEMRRIKKEERNRLEIDHEEVKEGISEKDEIIFELREKMRTFEELRIENDKNSQILTSLFDSGIIDADDNVVDQQRNNNIEW